jgi:hypothetical protein
MSVKRKVRVPVGRLDACTGSILYIARPRIVNAADLGARAELIALVAGSPRTYGTVVTTHDEAHPRAGLSVTRVGRQPRGHVRDVADRGEVLVTTTGHVPDELLAARDADADFERRVSDRSHERPRGLNGLAAVVRSCQPGTKMPSISSPAICPSKPSCASSADDEVS